MNTRCIIFDLDGTLVDSESLGGRVLLERLPEIKDSASALVLRYRGKKFAETLADLEKRFNCTIPEDFVPIYRKRAAEVFSSELQALPGVVEMLNTLEHPCCVASNAPQEKIQLALQVTDLHHFFGTRLYSAYDIGVWKPEPDLFLHAAENMNFRPEDCVVIEDSPTGVEAGIAAGMTVMHFSTEPIASNSKNYQAFSDMAELPRLLK